MLVTGGAGFIGSHVAEFYANNKEIDKVYIIDNLSRSQLLHKDSKYTTYNWDYLSKFEKIRRYQKDIRDLSFLTNFFKENPVDIVIHTAGQTAVTTSVTDPRSDFENNILGTFNLLETVRKSKSNPDLILCSTNKVFGNNVNRCNVIEKELRYEFSENCKKGISEDFSIDLCEHTPYGTSKLCSDLYFQEYGHLYGMRTAVFRMSCIYGTRQFGVEDQGWVAHFVISALTGRKLNIYGNGKQVRDILYISDLIEAYDSFIERSKQIRHGVFCLGGGIEKTLSLLELIEILQKEMGKKIDYELFDWRPSDQKVYISDITKAEQILGWKPKITPNEGVKRLVQWVSNNKSLFY